MKKIFISFVVDNIPQHYYQAELLLLSLEYFSKHPKENIIVQCIDSVNQEFITFLSDNEYQYRLIKEYLYGKYCNKIQQLDFFKLTTDCDVVLVDTDTFFLEPIRISDRNKFQAKIVDGPSPSLQSIKAIFKASKVKLPEIVKTDWEINEGITISANFNGGFYFIPSKYIDKVNISWKKWSLWLLINSEQFNDPKVLFHLDQLSMALAVCETKIDYSHLPTNFNCPIHSDTPQRYHNSAQPISLIHYHRKINSLGLLNLEKSSNRKVYNAIKKANSKIIEKCSFSFLEQFKRSLAALS